LIKASRLFPQSCAQIRKKRLRDAAQTGAERLVTVCHFCNQTFTAEEAHYDFRVTNYVDLVGEAMASGAKLSSRSRHVGGVWSGF